MNLDAIRNKSERFAIGLMSGTSCDGVDAALVRFKGTGPQLHVKLVEFKTFPYAEGFQARLLARHKDVHDVCMLNFELGDLLAEAALAMVRRGEHKGIEVDFVASHGHTIAHIPPGASPDGRGTLQIGEPSCIAERLGVPVVSDFRTRDMAVGGQGAPLVPYADWLLFHRDDRTVGCLNIGGISNITVVPPHADDVLAFDIGPGNMVIDGAMRLLTKGEQPMDEDGKMAAKGEVVDEFLDYLMDHPYFAKEPPKSCGREEFGVEVYLRDALAARRAQHSVEDIMATVTQAVAKAIADAHERFIKPRHELARLIVSGGGALNKTLMKSIKDALPGISVRKSDEYFLPADAKEAVAFAILGNETICGTPSNLPTATGAMKRVVLGKITPA